MKENDTLPNILIFIADEMRGDAISLNGIVNKIIKTPNIDHLAKEGVAFTNCFTVNPVCGPSRCCTFTGQYVHSNGHRSLYQLLQPHEENLFKFLKQKGYEVIWIGRNDLFDKNSIGESITKSIPVRKFNLKENPYPKNHPMYKSFHFGVRERENSKDMDFRIIQKVKEYLRSHLNKPFCLYVALRFPHPPYLVEEPFYSLHPRKNINLIPSKLEDKPEFMKLIHKRYRLNELNKNDFQEIRATYYGMISRLDSQFGEILSVLKDIEEYDDTAIFFFSDHGDFAGDYGLVEKWPNAFQDCLVRVPMVMKIPKTNPQNHIVDQLIQNIDLFPTILDIANLDTLYTHFGKSLLPLINGNTANLRDEVYSEGGYDLREPQCFETIIKSPDIPIAGIYYDKTNIPKENPQLVSRSVMIRTRLWKLIIRDKGKEELYDLMHDPNEINNLIDLHSYDEVIKELKEKLLRWYLKTSDNPDWKRARYI